MSESARASFSFSGDRALLEEISRALVEALQKFDVKINPELSLPELGKWEQDGGWFLQIEPDPWEQSGGWILDLEGRVSRREFGKPHELVVRDVWASLERASLTPDPNWEQAWGPLPEPKPGPGPDPMR